MQAAFQGHLLSRERFGNGAETTYGYHSQRRWLTTLETTLDATQIQALEYAHDAGGRVTQRHAPGRMSREHTYDAVGRLESTLSTPAQGSPDPRSPPARASTR